jgi:hypothetical protein
MDDFYVSYRDVAFYRKGCLIVGEPVDRDVLSLLVGEIHREIRTLSLPGGLFFPIMPVEMIFFRFEIADTFGFSRFRLCYIVGRGTSSYDARRSNP